MHFELGEFDKARAVHEENLARARALGNVRIVGTTLGALGEYDIREGKVAAAMPKLTEAFGIFRDLGHPFEIAVELCRFAWALARAGYGDAAAQVFSRSLLMYEEIGAEAPAWVRSMHLEILDAIREHIDSAAYAAAAARGRLLTVDEAVALAMAHEIADRPSV
jgi:tetratricopeptide (TPR) repeat protein